MLKASELIQFNNEVPPQLQFRWQELAVKWKEKLNISGRDVGLLFRLFKTSPDYMERLCSLAYEAKAPNPIAYILKVKRVERIKNKSS